MAERDKRHPIRIVARRTGTPETTLRAWERRYGAVAPVRAETGRRLYSDEDVHRLMLIRQAIDAGRSVSSVAGMSNAELQGLLESDRLAFGSDVRQASDKRVAGPEIIKLCLGAVADLNAHSLASNLSRAAMTFAAVSLIDDVADPLLHSIADLRDDGLFGLRHEHLATTVVRAVFIQLQSGVDNTGADTIVVATPSGRFHDLGTQFVSAIATTQGWNVVNLGANVTAVEIGLTAREVDAKLVALGIADYGNGGGTGPLEKATPYLATQLPARVLVLISGRSAKAHRESIVKAGGTIAESAVEFSTLLARLRDVG